MSLRPAAFGTAQAPPPPPPPLGDYNTSGALPFYGQARPETATDTQLLRTNLKVHVSFVLHVHQLGIRCQTTGSPPPMELQSCWIWNGSQIQ